MPAISVIIPCYNLGAYLDEAVESVFAQTMNDFEVLIVDDGSTDEITCALLRDFNRPKTRIVRQKNKGLPAARNQGIRQSTGRYICCLDADDRLRPEFLEKAVAVLETQPDVGFVTGYFQMFGDRTDVFRYQTCAFPEMLVYNQAVEPALFRREAWEKAGGYCETFSSSGIEDWDLWITILELGYRAEVIPEIVWDYRIRQDQMSTKMYQLDTWERLCGELVLRHERTYKKYMREVVSKHAARWVELREWVNDREQAIVWWERQSTAFHSLAEKRERAIQQQQTCIEELEKAKGWLEDQRSNWQRLAEEREQVIREQLRVNQEQQTWIGELEKAKSWLEEQRSNWRRLAEERERVIREQQSWIGELEKAKSRLEEQQSNWWGWLKRVTGKSGIKMFP